MSGRRGKNFIRIGSRKCYITYLLISINILCFGLELKAGGSEEVEVLYYLGGLVPQDVWRGEWWRLVSANFLHYGGWHLLMNVLGLYFLGRMVEFRLGILRYIIIYFLSGIGAMFAFSFLAVMNGNSGQILVGASAAIMGLVGAIFAIFIKEWLQYKTAKNSQRLKLIMGIIALQFWIDMTTPKISFLSHLLGLTIGSIGGMLMY